jgi:ABC-type multidrug transport system ATPase subunit
MNSLIETKGLSKYYGKGNAIKAVDGLDLTVYEGETFGLLGPNGAGKTTLVRLLNCIIKPSGGSASVKGYDILERPDDVKRVTGMLAESPGLYEKLSGYEFLRLVEIANPGIIYHSGRMHFFAFDGFVMYTFDCDDVDFSQPVIDAIEFSNYMWSE